MGLQKETIHLQSLITQENNIEWNKYNRYDSFEFLLTNKIPNYMYVKAIKCEEIVKKYNLRICKQYFNVFLFLTMMEQTYWDVKLQWIKSFLYIGHTGQIIQQNTFRVDIRK